MAKKKQREIIRRKGTNYVEIYSNHADLRSSFSDIQFFFGKLIEATPEKLEVEHLIGVTMSPQQTKEFLRVLTEHFAKYEKQYGPLPVPLTLTKPK